jgi:transmembrane sensor
VRVGDKVVVATGTSFSVELLQSQAHVLLYEGRVAVLDVKKEKPVLQKQRDRVTLSSADALLLPGRELVVAVNSPSAAAIVEPVNTSRSLSWESGQLSFEDEPLSIAVERVNRYSKRKVVIADPSIARMHVNGIVNVGDVDAFVEAVTAFNPVRVVSNANEIRLVR